MSTTVLLRCDGGGRDLCPIVVAAHNEDVADIAERAIAAGWLLDERHGDFCPYHVRSTAQGKRPRTDPNM